MHSYLSSPQRTMRATWQAMQKASPVLVWLGASLLALSALTLALSAADDRILNGVSIWHKPWKFQISVGVYFLTLAWVLSLFTPAAKPKASRSIAAVAIAAGLFEVIYITWQAALGQASHYNVGTSFHARMYTAMGVGAVLLTSTSGVLGYHVLRAKAHAFASTPAMRHAIGWGLSITCALGIATGGVLGERTRAGGHWVGGTANDALGLAVLNWSRDGGDLRVAHFFALHAVQLLPLLAWGLSLLALCITPQVWRNSARAQLWTVWLAAAGYSTFCLFTLAQALRGQPLWACV